MNRIALYSLPALAALLLGAGDAAAWGPKAQEAITATALQVVMREYPEAFRPGKMNYEKDALKGGADGYAVLEGVPLNNDTAVIQVIANQIQLLRDVRTYGPSSYFAYRMGVLSSLVADAMLPYGFVWKPEDEQLRKRITADIDAHIESYAYETNERYRTLIRDAHGYFTEHRVFNAQDKILIADDYARGAHYNGFLSKAGPSYFARTIDAVADVWHTVLYTEGVTKQATSSEPLAVYFVNEIAFLLNEKRNMYQAGEAYKNFEKVAQQQPDLYERIGDLYYAFDAPEAVDRAVHEWQIAYSMGGPVRRNVAAKLSKHYFELGQKSFEEGSKKGSSDAALPTALNGFEKALDFDRTNKQAADMIQQTHVAITQRKERLDLAMNIIAQAEKVVAQADQAKVENDLAVALRSYRQVGTLTEAVDDEFPDQQKIAQDKAREADNGINEVLRRILDQASDTIDKADKAKESHQYEQAIQMYTSVPPSLELINEAGKPSYNDEKQTIEKLASDRVEEAKKEKVRYEQAKEEEKKSGGRPKAGAAPAAKPAAK